MKSKQGFEGVDWPLSVPPTIEGDVGKKQALPAVTRVESAVGADWWHCHHCYQPTPTVCHLCGQGSYVLISLLGVMLVCGVRPDRVFMWVCGRLEDFSTDHGFCL